MKKGEFIIAKRMTKREFIGLSFYCVWNVFASLMIILSAKEEIIVKLIFICVIIVSIWGLITSRRIYHASKLQ